MIYFWSKNQATATIKALKDDGVPAERGVNWEKARTAKLVVNWGRRDAPTGCVNGNAPCDNKLRELELLNRNGVNVVNFSRQHRMGWYPRSFHHWGSKDFTDGLVVGDYYTEPAEFVREFRVHSGKDRLILIGEKVHDNEFRGTRNPRIRAERTGWVLNYGERRGVIPRALPEIGRDAVHALGFDFGAVDVGLTPDGRLIVLEVNSAPGAREVLGRHYAAFFKRLYDSA